jgi:hypothetical protein
MHVEKKLAVTLSNGRSHVLQLPQDVDPRVAAEALCGLRSAAEAGWLEADGEWLPFEQGEGWLRRSAISEIAIVEWVESAEIYGES